MALSIQCRSSMTTTWGRSSRRAADQPRERLEGLAAARAGDPWPRHVGIARVHAERRDRRYGTIGRRSSPRRETARARSCSTIAASRSRSSIPKLRLRRSISGWNGMARPKDRQWPSSHVARSPTRRRNSWSRRDLPMPGLADDEDDLPLARRRPARRPPAGASSSRSRPTSGRQPALGARPRAASAPARADTTSQARHRLGLALERQLAEGPRLEVARRRAGASPPRSRRARARPPAACARRRWSCRPPPCSPCAGRCRCCRRRRGPC